MSHPPRRRISVYPVALACAALLLLTSCHGSSKHDATTRTSAVPSTNAKGKPGVSLALGLGSRQVQAVGPSRPFDLVTAKKIRKVVNAYISTAITHPLFTGVSATGLVRYFTPNLASRVGTRGHDRAALTDEHAPVITSVNQTVKRPLDLVALEVHGQIVMIGAQFALTVKGMTDQGPLTVSRVGNFVFEADAAKHWHITGYDIIVRRDNTRASTTQKATTTTAPA